MYYFYCHSPRAGKMQLIREIVPLVLVQHGVSYIGRERCVLGRG